jgi:hypothetical protein
MKELILLVTFLAFSLIQSMFIVGVKDCFGESMIFYKLGVWIKRNIGEYWSKPLFSCVRCMAGVWGAITYWPAVIFTYGFDWVEVPVFIINIGVLIYLNWFLYKRQ